MCSLLLILIANYISVLKDSTMALSVYKANFVKFSLCVLVMFLQHMLYVCMHIFICVHICLVS